jgi:hypothetical protein
MVFLFAHECGHHALGHIVSALRGGFIGPEQELAADCFAKRQLLGKDVLGVTEFSAVLEFLREIPGDPTTYPGPVRVRKMKDC